MPVVDLEASRRLKEGLGAVAKKVKRHRCPLCGTNDWVAVLTSLGTIVLDESSPLVKPKRDLALVPMPVLILVCKYCGYMRLHNVTFLTLETTAENEETSSDSGSGPGDDRSKPKEV